MHYEPHKPHGRSTGIHLWTNSFAIPSGSTIVKWTIGSHRHLGSKTWYHRSGYGRTSTHSICPHNMDSRCHAHRFMENIPGKYIAMDKDLRICIFTEPRMEPIANRISQITLPNADTTMQSFLLVDSAKDCRLWHRSLDLCMNSDCSKHQSDAPIPVLLVR